MNHRIKMSTPLARKKLRCGSARHDEPVVLSLPLRFFREARQGREHHARPSFVTSDRYDEYGYSVFQTTLPAFELETLIKDLLK